MTIQELLVDGHFAGTTAQELAYNLADQATQFCVTLPGESQANVKKKLRTMAKTLRALRIAALAAVCLALAGCNFSVFDACLVSAAGLEVIASTSKSATPEQKAEALAWVQAVTSGVSQASADVAAGGTPASIAAAVTEDMFAAFVSQPQLAGWPTDLALAVSATAATVNAILEAYRPAGATINLTHGAKVKTSKIDQKRALEIKSRAQAISDDAQRVGQQ